MKLSDCPVLERRHWDEDDARVAMDWLLERGLLDDGLLWLNNEGNLLFLPQHVRAALVRDINPSDFDIRVAWEKDHTPDWSWLKSNESPGDYVMMCARVQSRIQTPIHYPEWQDGLVSLCGIAFARTSPARFGYVHAFRDGAGGLGALQGESIVAQPWVDGNPWYGSGFGDPYQREVSLQLIDEFGAEEPHHKTVTDVVFRRYPDEQIIALFPEEDAGNGRCMSYMHIGQHGDADYAHVVARTRPATPEQYDDLRQELESIGYVLRVGQRRRRRRAREVIG